MLITTKNLLSEAQKNRTAIGAFNVSDLEITQAVVQAGRDLNQPVIIQTTTKAIQYAGLSFLADIIKRFAKESNIGIVLHLDHGKDINLIKQCLAAGYTSIMFDGSELSFEQNVAATKQIVVLANSYNVPVEGEVGTVPSPGGNNQIAKTDVRKAIDFVRQTGVASLAVAIGTTHGQDRSAEQLDFNLLKELRESLEIPLVLHGASGIADDQIKQLIDFGISKINIDTDIRLAFSNSIKEFSAAHPDVFDPREIMTVGRDAVYKVVYNKIKLFARKV